MINRGFFPAGYGLVPMEIITLQPLKSMYTLKKSLGQHFLHDDATCRKIVNMLHVSEGVQVLEIGPGGGAITQYLKDIPGIFFRAIEIDREKISYLKNRFPDLKEKLTEGDILKIPPPFKGDFSIIGNFPYNISSQILFRILEWKEQVPCVVGMFQKEVAKRISSKPDNKEYGILSVLTQAYYKTEYLFEVSEGCFTPPPKVKSAVIRLTHRETPFDIPDKKKFFTLVKTAFHQRRKILRNPLRHLFTEEILREEIFSRRAEELTISEFIELSKKML